MGKLTLILKSSKKLTAEQTKIRWATIKRTLYNEYIDKRCNHRCSACGEKFKGYMFDFHHRDPETKSFGINSDTWRFSQKLAPRTINEAAKCDILCPNCHRTHHHLNGGAGRPRHDEIDNRHRDKWVEPEQDLDYCDQGDLFE